MIEKSEKKKRKNNGKRRKFWIIHEKTESILILMQVMGSWADQRWIFTIHPNEEANGNKTAVRNDIHVLRGGGNMYTFEQCLPFSRRFYDDVYSRRSSRETGVKNNLVRRETLVITFLRFSQFPSWERWVDIYFFFFLLTRNYISFYLFFLFFFRDGIQRDQGAKMECLYPWLVIFYAIIQMHACPGVLFRNFNFEANFQEYLNICILKYSILE